ncbi:DUF4270 family protein [Lutibacter sp. HS1-25]|uniref:DUF4270 family protein n=1 Tax=Lutibacter sp. HS1-25 TaxID=2485000 RepID=UPI001011E7D7|nr:DUF4270 family protein [Lutibacter sp. HS1-25]RXP61382.1 DUF4270 family protein [Lutibacter sp. HS1-25]
MKHYLLIILIGFGIVISCNNENTIYEVGQDFIDSNTLIFEVDTLSLKISTIISDSLVTSGTARILIGALQDNDFGNLTAQSYFSVYSSVFNLDKNAIFDSISLVMHYDRYYYGDTTLVQTYKVYEIIEVFEPNDEDTYFYNTSSLAYNTEPIGKQSFTPYPNKRDSINIPLNYGFGKNIFDKIVDDEITDSNDLTKEFRGITIKSDPNTNTILGFNYSTYNDQSTSIRLYYTLNDGDNSENNKYYLDLKLEGGNKIFNNITSDKTNTFLSSLADSEDILSSTETNNKTYIQSGTGISMRVDMPTLSTLNALENNGTALGALLKIYPDYSSYDDVNLIDSLAVYIIDNKNRTIKQLTSLSGSAVYAKLNSEENEFDSSTNYTVDVSAFVEEILTSSYTLNYALRFEFPSNTSTINRILINDNKSPENSNYKMKLLLTYLTY